MKKYQNKNRIFNEQYGEVKSTVVSDKGPFIYRIFRRFEEHRILAVSRLIKGKKLDVLDIGFCNGQFLTENIRKWKSIIGIDVVPSLIKKGRNKHYPVPAKFYLSDLGRQRIQLPDNSLDLVVIIATLQLVYDIDLLFETVNRILRPKGQLIIQVPNPMVFWKRLMYLFGYFPRTSGYSNALDGGGLYIILHNRALLITFKKKALW